MEIFSNWGYNVLVPAPFVETTAHSKLKEYFAIPFTFNHISQLIKFQVAFKR